MEQIGNKRCLEMHMKKIHHKMVHTVKPGETLWKIAHHHHTTVHHLIHLNPQIKDPNLIYPGQRIKVH